MSTTEDLLARQHAKQGPRRFSGERITCFDTLTAFDIQKDHAERCLELAYSAVYAASMAVEALPGVIGHDYSNDLDRMAVRIEDMQAFVRNWDGGTEA